MGVLEGLSGSRRVVYDISALGLGHCHTVARAGIFRVVERLALGLAAAPGWDLTFCATHSLRAWNQSADYLASDPRLQHIPLIESGGMPGLERVLYEHVRSFNSGPRSSFPARLPRSLLFRLYGLVERHARLRSHRRAGPVDILHHPLGPLPRRDRGAVSSARFLTVYDLIPVRFPQFCDEDIPEAMGRVYRSLRADDWALAISENTKADLCEYRGIDPDRVFVTRLAADPTIFYPECDDERLAQVRSRYGIGEGPYLLGLNTLEPRKNLEHVVRCFARLVHEERIPDLKLVLVGAKGWRYQGILTAIEGMNHLRDRIVLTGYAADEDLAPLYSGATAFVYLSFYEGFGLPPLEAMQCGVPVITSNTSSLPEVVQDAGIMIDPTDADGLVQSVLNLYRNPALRENLRERSLARAREFSWERCVEETLGAYRTALGS